MNKRKILLSLFFGLMLCGMHSIQCSESTYKKCAFQKVNNTVWVIRTIRSDDPEKKGAIDSFLTLEENLLTGYHIVTSCPADYSKDATPVFNHPLESELKAALADYLLQQNKEF